ncbi:MAG: YfbM family protein [Gammaproteobacteria bacterium]|nr:YfbM family protein [Gammaproteobacteria bacterium]
MHFALLDEEVATLRGLSDESDRLTFLQEGLEETYFADARDYMAESDNAWDAIHRALTGGELSFDSGTYPLSHTVLGGELLYSGHDYIMSLKTAEQTRDVSAALAAIDKPDFRRRYFQIDAQSYGAALSDDDFEYTWEWFVEVRKLFAQAAKDRRAVLFTADQ